MVWHQTNNLRYGRENHAAALAFMSTEAVNKRLIGLCLANEQILQLAGLIPSEGPVARAIGNLKQLPANWADSFRKLF